MELSVHELWELVLSEPAKDASGRMVRKMRLGASIVQPVRLLPQAVLRTASTLLETSEGAQLVADYIQNAFFYYRACVSRDPLGGAPHVLNGEAYEWPSPAYFQWADIEDVIFYGRLILPVHHRKEVAVTREEQGTVNVKLPLRGRQFSREATRIDSPEKELKFLIPELSLVAFVDPTEWQITSLRRYANPIGKLYDDLKKRSLRPEEEVEILLRFVESISSPELFPVRMFDLEQISS